MPEQTKEVINEEKTKVKTNNKGMLDYTQETKKQADFNDRIQNQNKKNYPYALFSSIYPKNILLIGNGFDLEAGLKSSFRDFILYIIYGCVFYQYENLIENFNKGIFREYISSENNVIEYALKKQYQSNHTIWKLCHKFASSHLGEVLLKKGIIPRLYDYIIDSKIIISIPVKIPNLRPQEPDPKKFAYGLSPNQPSITSYQLFNCLQKEVTNKGIETFDFLLKHEVERNKTNIALWLDVENVIEMLVLKQDSLLNKYDYSKKDLEKTPTEYYLKDLDLFENLLSEYLKKEERNTTKSSKSFFHDITKDYSDSLYKRSHQRISQVTIEQADCIINYNYTNTAENLFKKLRKKLDKTNNHASFIRHINGAIDIQDAIKVKEIDNNIVVGYSNHKNIEVPRDLFTFEKKARRVIKNTDYVNINNVIDNKEFDLVIMGHSCGVADSDILAKLLSSSYLRSAVVLCYSVDDMTSIYDNIKSMLEPEIFDELMDHSDFRKNLYFSVRAPNRKENTNY
ncbi:Bacteriophage abortive infection AbiH [Succinivibrio dextrinosolvens DSM 3072]|uniref:Bacteriophage abortive infection AbiH n=1 Tax=Succinivibrio dextrinosolvens DSM 3072 TaxID=1123324 RepID=A0A1T4UZD6_9GAMM|nr:AbiH family protein [Succinivibrio dextrinosolvens]SKA58004.1 Bacteriophage abortive infection AbiH [Succinivibrio dextrinosolvens DSM 3072]